MSDEETTQTIGKEVVIDLNGEEDHEDRVEDTAVTESAGDKAESLNKFVTKKCLKDLTDEEKATIISNAKRGIDQPYYDIKTLKNGSTRIIFKKKTTTTAQKVISSSDPIKSDRDQRAYYTDNQLLFEHIIELNTKMDRLMNKHKKLKRRYESLQRDLYVDDDEVGDAVGVGDEGGEQPVEQQPVERATRSRNSFVQPVSRSSWRSKITYL